MSIAARLRVIALLAAAAVCLASCGLGRPEPVAPFLPGASVRLDPAHGSLDIAVCVAASVETVRVATRRDRSEPWHEVWVGSYDPVPLDAGAWISGSDARWDAGATVRERLEPEPGDLLLVEWSGSDPVPWSSGSGEMVIGPTALEGALWMSGPGMLSPRPCG